MVKIPLGEVCSTLLYKILEMFLLKHIENRKYTNIYTHKQSENLEIKISYLGWIPPKKEKGTVLIKLHE